MWGPIGRFGLCDNEKIQTMYCQQTYGINYMIILRIFARLLIQNLKQYADIFNNMRNYAEMWDFILQIDELFAKLLPHISHRPLSTMQNRFDQGFLPL